MPRNQQCRVGRVIYWPLAIAILLSATASVACAQHPLSAAEFFQQSSRLQRKLDAPLTLEYRDVPLRSALDRLAQSQNIDVWIDRRVDPTQELSLDANNQALRQVLSDLATAGQSATTTLGDLVYVGPKEKVGELRTLVALAHQHVHRMPPAVREGLLRREELSLARLTEPREAIAHLVASRGIKLENPRAIPHDLWPAGRLPALSGAAQLSVLLAGFDLAWEPGKGDNTLRIVPIPRPVVIERKLGGTPPAELQQLLAEDPSVKLRQSGGEAWLTARVEQHEGLQAKPSASTRPPRRTRTTTERQVYSLTLRDQPVGGLLRQLAAKLNRKLVLSDDLIADGAPLSKRITFAVDQVDLEELLAEIAEQAQLTIEGDEQEIRVALPR